MLSKIHSKVPMLYGDFMSHFVNSCQLMINMCRKVFRNFLFGCETWSPAFTNEHVYNFPQPPIQWVRIGSFPGGKAAGA
jgi:hypothetical protein